MAALDLLLFLDDKDRVEDFVEEFKLQLVGSDPTFWASKLYPEFFTEGQEPEDAYDLDQKDVKWVMPQMSEAEMQALLDEMMANDPSAMTLEEYDEQGWE